MISEYALNDIVEMKKEHPCHKSKYWKIISSYSSIRIVMHSLSFIFVISFRKKRRPQCDIIRRNLMNPKPFRNSFPI